MENASPVNSSQRVVSTGFPLCEKGLGNMLVLNVSLDAPLEEFAIFVVPIFM